MGGSPTSSPNLFFGLAQRAARLLSGKAAPVAIAVILIYLVIEFLRKLPG
jgi:hypothetical protein